MWAVAPAALTTVYPKIGFQLQTLEQLQPSPNYMVFFKQEPHIWCMFRYNGQEYYTISSTCSFIDSRDVLSCTSLSNFLVQCVKR